MVYLSWNATNFVTIVLMAALGFMILGAIAKVVAQYNNGE